METSFYVLEIVDGGRELYRPCLGGTLRGVWESSLSTFRRIVFALKGYTLYNINADWTT